MIVLDHVVGRQILSIERQRFGCLAQRRARDQKTANRNPQEAAVMFHYAFPLQTISGKNCTFRRPDEDPASTARLEHLVQRRDRRKPLTLGAGDTLEKDKS